MIKGIYRVIEFILGFVIILTLLLVIRLSRGPIEIKNLTPVIVDALVSNEKGVEVNMENAFIELAFSRGRLMDIRLNELNVIDNEGFVLSVEKANISFNPFWLLLGRVVVRDIDLYKPYIQMDFTDTSDKAAVKDVPPARPIGRKLNRARRYAERLDSVKITDAEVVLKIRPDASVLLPDLDILILREDEKMDFSAAGKFYFDGAFIDWNMNALYQLNDKTMAFEVFVDDVDLYKMKSIVPMFENVKLTLDASVKGNLNLTQLKENWRNAFNGVTFKAATQSAGSLYLPKPLDTTYQVQKAEIMGAIDPKLEQIHLNHSKVQILDKTAEVNAQVSGLGVLFETGDFSSLPISLTAEINDIPMAEVPHLWPAYLGTDAHDWIRQNISGGVITKATLFLGMKGENITGLSSVLDVKGVTVRYVDEMLPATNVSGIVSLDLNSAKIQVLGGQVNNVQAVGGYVNFLKLDEDVPLFDMDVEFKGRVQDGLKIVATEPLKVCDMSVLVPCKSGKGMAKGHVALSFPFVDEDAIADLIKYAVTVDLDDTSFPLPKTDWTVSEGNFKLFVNNDKLTIKGRGLLDDKPMQLDVLQLFDDDKEHDSVYQVRLPVTASMITPYFEQAPNFLKGSLLTDITIRPLTDNENTVGLEFGLKDAEISLPIGYVKEFNQNGTLKATLSIVNDQLAAVPSIYLSIPDENILIKGRVDFPKNTVFQLNLSQIKAPRTDANMMLSYGNDGNFDVNIAGTSLDIADLLHGDFFNRPYSAEEAQKVNQMKPKDFSVKAKVDTLYLSEKEKSFSNVELELKKQNGYWQQIKGSLMGNVPFTFALTDDKSALSIQTQDVGEFLRRSGYTDRIKGGTLNTTLTQSQDGTLSGQINVKDYQLTDTSFFMQAATLLGIVDAVRGNTIHFDRALIPFKLSPTHVVTIEDAVASGTALGITMRGTVDSEKVALNGSVVPAYALNSLPGKIPVVGTLLSGEEGGGLFGVSYAISGKTDKPEFSFNPASLLTPGIFRRLFD